MKAPVNTKTRKPENAKTGGINLWTRKRRKRENGENKKTAKTGKTRKRRKPENGENDENPKTAKSVPVFWFSISRFLVFSVFWFSCFLVFSFRWPHPSGQVAFFMCLVVIYCFKIATPGGGEHRYMYNVYQSILKKGSINVVNEYTKLKQKKQTPQVLFLLICLSGLPPEQFF